MNNHIFLFSLLFTTSLFTTGLFASEDSDYKDFLSKNNKEFAQYKAGINEEFKQYKKILDQEFSRYKKELSIYWQQPELSSNTKWVEYSKDSLLKSSVDFENGEIVVEVIAANLAEAEEKLLKSLANVSVKNTEQAHKDDILAQRVEAKTAATKARINPRPLVADLIYPKEPTAADISKYTKKHVTKKTIKQKKSKVKGKKVYSVKVKMPENYHFKKAELYLADIGDNAKRFKISPSLVLAIMKNESAFNPMARSHVPAFGLMQIVPSSAGVDAYDFIYKKKLVLGSSYLYNSKNNIELGTVYLHILDKRYLRKITNDESRLYCTIAAYNTGAGNVARVFTGNKNISKAAKAINKLTPRQVYNKLINDLPYEETKKYLQKVRNSMTRFQNI